jgi:hypothetical protein
MQYIDSYITYYSDENYFKTTRVVAYASTLEEWNAYIFYSDKERSYKILFYIYGTWPW